MKNIFKIAAASVLLASTINVSHAATADITITANVDTAVGITQANGLAIEPQQTMNYDFGSKSLSPLVNNIKLYTTAPDKDILVRLAEEPALANSADQTKTIPLTVTLGTTQLTTADQNFSVTSIFPKDKSDATKADVSGGSNPLVLKIAQKDPKASPEQGEYNGKVSLILGVTP